MHGIREFERLWNLFESSPWLYAPFSRTSGLEQKTIIVLALRFDSNFLKTALDI